MHRKEQQGIVTLSAYSMQLVYYDALDYVIHTIDVVHICAINDEKGRNLAAKLTGPHLHVQRAPRHAQDAACVMVILHGHGHGPGPCPVHRNPMWSWSC